MRARPSVGDRVLANCGERRKPEYVPGVVVNPGEIYGQFRKVQIQLDYADSDGGDIYWFPLSLLCQDNARNRRRHDLPTAEAR